ncbi:hypothetical protein D3C81_2342750 [compost metagenome]
MPRIAAAISKPSNSHRFMLPEAQNAPAMNSRVSPGRKGNTTRPVSLKIIANSTT